MFYEIFDFIRKNLKRKRMTRGVQFMNEILNDPSKVQDTNYIRSYLKGVSLLYQRWNSEKPLLYNFYGKVFPTDERFYEYLAIVMAPFIYPNKTDDGKIHLSLNAISYIWRDLPKEAEVSQEVEEATIEMIAESIERCLAKMKYLPNLDKLDPSKLENVFVEELEEEFTPLSRMALEEAGISMEEIERARGKKKSESGENKKEDDGAKALSDEEREAIEAIAKLAGEHAKEEPEEAEENGAEEPSEEKRSESKVYMTAMDAVKEELYSAKTFREFAESFAKLFKKINYEEFFSFYVNNPEIGELFFELRERLEDRRLYGPMVFGLLALDWAGNEVPSVLAFGDKGEKTEPTIYSGIHVGAAKGVDLMKRVSLLAHTVSALKYALRDIPTRLTTHDIMKSEVGEVLVGLLLHDIGKIPVYRKEVRGVEHAVYGGNFLEEFFHDIPRSVVEAVRHHHDRPEIKDPKAETETHSDTAVLKLVKLYDRTERQIELYVLSPVPKLVSIEGTGHFKEEDTLYLRNWIAEHPDFGAPPKKTRKKKAIDSSLEEEARKFVEYVKSNNISYRKEGKYYVFNVRAVKDAIVGLENEARRQRLKDAVVRKDARLLVSRDLIGEL